jgi:hypothetical protein
MYYYLLKYVSCLKVLLDLTYKTFNTKNDFTPEEEEIRRENQWAFG